jgi:hypothetical protein
MEKVSLKDFIITGIFGPFHLGMTRSQIKALLGSPDEVGGVSRKNKVPSIWKYGDIELHYKNDNDSLFMIYLDNFDIPNGGSKIDLEPWIIRRGISRKVVEEQMIQNQINYCVLESPYDENNSRLVIGIGIELLFIEKQQSKFDPEEGLYSLSYSMK